MDAQPLICRRSGIFPKDSSAATLLELRARTTLALAHKLGLLNKTEQRLNKSEKVVIFSMDASEPSADEMAYTITGKINTGLIYTVDRESGWKNQPKRLFLYVDSNVNIDASLHRYFQPSLRWLDDHPTSRQDIEQSFKEV